MDERNKDAIYLELLNKISDEVRETRNIINNIDKKVDLHVQKTDFELQAINKLDQQQNVLLAEHIAGVNTLKNIFDSTQSVNDARLAKLEEPRKWLSTTWKILIGVSVAAGAIVGIVEFFKLF